MSKETELIKQIEVEVANLKQAVADAEYWHGKCVEEAQQQHQVRVAQIQAEHNRALAETKSAYEKMLAEVGEEMREISKAAGYTGAPWDDASWDDWQPEPGGHLAKPQTRIGRFMEKGQWHSLRFPALLPFLTQRPLLIEVSGAPKNQAVVAVQAFLLRVLATVPPGKVRFTFLDPIGLGQNVAPFMHLADYDETLVGGKAWTEPQHIEQRLADLTEHMEVVIQKYLRNEFATIEEYNARAGEVAEPYRVMVVMDFPARFSEEAANRLISIVQNGPRCGVYAVVLADASRQLPHGFSMDELRRAANSITWDGQRFVWQDPDFKSCVLELDGLPEKPLMDRIIKAVGQAAKDANRVEVPFEKLFDIFREESAKNGVDLSRRGLPASVALADQSTWWRGSTANGIMAMLGPSGARKLQFLDLGRGTAHHALVAGRIGAGKSTLMHTLIVTLSLLYSPEELQLYLVDFKKGVEFKIYATHQLPHARVIAIESEREFGLSVLQGLDAELKRRGDLFRAAGVDHIADHRSRSGQVVPRLLLIVDEFQEFFIEDDALASQAGQILDRLVRQGRAFGIHVVLGSQTLAGAYSLARSTIDQMAVRIALQCSEADSRLILADDNPAARLLSRPGEAIYNASNGMVEGNSRFQVAFLPDDMRDSLLGRLSRLTAQRGRSSTSQIVFEGNAPSHVEKNAQLQELLAAPVWTAPARAVRAWLGEPVAIREPVAASFRKQSSSNLLIVGQNDELALAMFTSALISLAAQHKPLQEGDTPFSILDFGATDSPQADFLTQIASKLPHRPVIGKRRQLAEIIDRLARDVQQRVASEASSAPARYLFIYGFQRARDLRQEDLYSLGSINEESSAPNSAQQFATILREGPDVGIHTILWCDTVTNLNRNLDHALLREFAMRVAFQMGTEDSNRLIDSSAADRLGSFRALLYDEEESRIEKFRPYALPDREWLSRLSQQLASKR